VNGSSLSIFNIPAGSIRACVNYSNGTAVYWIRDNGGRNFTFSVNSKVNDINWSIVARTSWPEINIMNFLRWILENGNVTGIKRTGSYYEFHVFLRQEDESNAGTIEEPYVIRIVETWNVTLRVKSNGEPVSGRFSGRIGGAFKRL